MTPPHNAAPLALWGGLECTVNRVRDDYFCQMERNGHAVRDDDLERFAALGIRAIRYPVLWERTAPGRIEEADWSWPDARLPALRALGIEPIVGLVHHGSGPRHTSLVDPEFAPKLAAFAGAVAQRYPWVEYYTPVNEPLTTARFSGLYGVWYPHGRDEATFVRALLNQCRATVLAMRAIRAVNPHAKLVQTDDLGKSYGTPEVADVVEFYNERRWLAWDLLCGKVDENHALWEYLLGTGHDAAELLWFRDNPCPPDIIGVNYYITSERWLDHRTERYPQTFVGECHGRPLADIHTALVLATPTPGIGPLLQEAWERYRLPMAVTEAHIDANREDQMRWLLEIWEAAQQLQRTGVDMRAVTVWALLGSWDWNCLVTECRGYYEPGPYDVRSPQPRPTAVATLMRELATDRPLSHPVLHGQGWWRRPGRFVAQPVATPTAATSIPIEPHRLLGHGVRPILVVGGTGTLGSAFARLCEKRNLACQVVTRRQMDMADPASVERALERWQPWAVINAAGFVRVDDAEADRERCLRENTHGPAVLAAMCAVRGIRLLTFSSDLVFDGAKEGPYVESDLPNPLNTYGEAKLRAERKVMAIYPDALVVRTAAFFGPWDHGNFITQALRALAAGQPFAAACDQVVTPTYVPDLVNVCLDLLIDGECGIWHLTHGEAMSWVELARAACVVAGVDAVLLAGVPSARLGLAAARPRNSALASERGMLLPSFEDALARYLAERLEEGIADALLPASGTGS